jgi:Arc/MetJ-type ribon-helix-helix transcriptional regulator
MTIELSPELERAIREAVTSGHYPSAEDVLVEAIALWQAHQKEAALASDQRSHAIERLRTFGKSHGLSLGGMTIRQLRDESRPEMHRRRCLDNTVLVLP